MKSIQITAIRHPERKIQSIKLIRNFLTVAVKGRGLMGLREAKDLVDNYHDGSPFPKLWVYQTLNNEFGEQFEYKIEAVVERESLKLFRVAVICDRNLAPPDNLAPTTKVAVVVLSVSSEKAKIAALETAEKKYSSAVRVSAVTEITKFKNNMVIAIYEF